MIALMLAQKELGHFDLGAARFPEHRLVTSGKMCAMCLGNVCWSGVSEVLSSAEPEDVEKITGFDEGPTPSDYNMQLERRGIKIVPEFLRSEGQAVLQLYVDLGGKVYNARHSQESSLTEFFHNLKKFVNHTGISTFTQTNHMSMSVYIRVFKT